MTDVSIPTLSAVAPSSGDTAVGVQGGQVKRLYTGPSFAQLTAATGATLVGVQPGNTKRALSEKLADLLSVKDFGAVGDGVADDTAAFSAAAAATKHPRVPAGTYFLGAAVTGSANTVWHIDAGASITGLAPVGGGYKIDDTSRLPGKMIKFGDNSNTAARFGTTNPWLERDVRTATESIATVTAVSGTGQIAFQAATRTSDDPTANMAGIAIAGLAVNDNTANPEPAWAGYLEARRSTGAGATYSLELDIVNFGTADSVQPFTNLTSNKQAVNLWISCGGGGVTGAVGASAAIGIIPNSQSFERGIVFFSGALNTTLNEALTMPQGAKVAWYHSTAGLVSYMYGQGAQFTSLSDTATAGYQRAYIRKRADGVTATGSLDAVTRDDFWGYSGSANYSAGFVQVLQRTAFSTGNARFSYDIAIKGDSGVQHQVTLNGLANASFAPNPDNTINLGTASFRWATVFAGTSTISTSDGRTKQQVRPLNEAEQAVAKRLKGLIRAFKFNEAVQAKGDEARTHVGVIAQDVIAAFKAEGLDAMAYAVVCHDEWEADENGPAGDRYGIRYEQLLAFIVAAI